SSTLLLAEAYPRTTVVGSDYHAASIELARKKTADAGAADRVTFEVATAQTFTGSGYDLVTMFDCLHDMGDAVEDNLNPVSRLYYNGSLFLCVPNALSQPGGYALGAQAGEAAIREVVTAAGFTRFRQAARTAFNLVYEIRP